jgi:hypothetical protein
MMSNNIDEMGTRSEYLMESSPSKGVKFAEEAHLWTRVVALSRKVRTMKTET